ncbi:hypothetical protein Ocin01_09264 [Orchesella cincta]|uniref:Uncharacterized protein n=1 Tax=Orchesella cincta TaxID=48709 RepID=A0A1D2MWL3_ORCCI|nr:hypothetical protein Ocin01_09264 [Orchesella cincta]
MMAGSKEEDDKCPCDSPEESSHNDKTTSASRKRSPNTRISTVSSGSSKSKRLLGSPSSNTTSSQEENVTAVEGEGGKSHGEPNNMETDACATETGLVSTISSVSSTSSSGYSSGRSNKQHANRGNSKSADGCCSNSNNGKENRVPSSSLTSKAGVTNGGSASPVPIIKNRPQRSFIGYVSPYEQFLRYTETDPKYRSEKSQGKILGLYKFCGEIGSGNFSKVMFFVAKV